MRQIDQLRRRPTDAALLFEANSLLRNASALAELARLLPEGASLHPAAAVEAAPWLTSGSARGRVPCRAH